MALNRRVEKLERQMQPPGDFIIYIPTGLLDDSDPPGMIKVTCWSKPEWEEIITCEEYERRKREAIANGDVVCGPGWDSIERKLNNET